MTANDPAEVQARAYTTLALETLADVMRSADKDSARVAAAVALLDRGHGKPTQAVIAVPQRVALGAALAALTDQELLAMIADARNRRAGGDALPGQSSGRLETACDPLNQSQRAPCDEEIGINFLLRGPQTATPVPLEIKDPPARPDEFPICDPLLD